MQHTFHLRITDKQHKYVHTVIKLNAHTAKSTVDW